MSIKAVREVKISPLSCQVFNIQLVILTGGLNLSFGPWIFNPSLIKAQFRSLCRKTLNNTPTFYHHLLHQKLLLSVNHINFRICVVIHLNGAINVHHLLNLIQLVWHGSEWNFLVCFLISRLMWSIGLPNFYFHQSIFSFSRIILVSSLFL